MSLVFNPCSNGYTGDGGCDFDKDHGKVSQANELFSSLNAFAASFRSLSLFSRLLNTYDLRSLATDGV